MWYVLQEGEGTDVSIVRCLDARGDGVTVVG